MTAIFCSTSLRFVERFLAELETGLARLALRFADGGGGAARPAPGAGDTALQVDDFAPRVEQLGLRHDVLGGQRLEHLHALLGERQAAAQAADGRLRLRPFRGGAARPTR